MTERLRYYLWSEAGPMRLSQAVMSTDRTLPQYAGTTQKYLSACYGWRGDKLLCHLDGAYLSFDENGQLDTNAIAMRVVDTMNAWDLENRAKRMEVPDLGMIRKARDLRNRYRWEPSEAETADSDRTGHLFRLESGHFDSCCACGLVGKATLVNSHAES